MGGLNHSGGLAVFVMGFEIVAVASLFAFLIFYFVLKKRLKKQKEQQAQAKTAIRSSSEN